MSDRPKPKPISQKGRNEERKNGKAFKKGNRGSRKTPLTPLQKALLGGGAMRTISRPPKEKPERLEA